MRIARPLLVFAIVLVVSGGLHAKEKENAPESSTSFTVLKDDNGKPIRNAAVVLHPVGKNGRQMKNGFELKTDEDGKTHFDGIPYGVLRIQVIAPGFQTFGNDFQIDKPNQEITIRLKRPQQQYSIYDKHDDSSGSTSPAK